MQIIFTYFSTTKKNNKNNSTTESQLQQKFVVRHLSLKNTRLIINRFKKTAEKNEESIILIVPSRRSPANIIAFHQGREYRKDVEKESELHACISELTLPKHAYFA